MLDVVIVKEATDNWFDFVLFAVATFSARISDDCTHAGNNCRVFHKARIRISFQGRKNGYVYAALFESVNIIAVLFKGTFINRLTEFGSARNAVAKRFAGTAHDYVAKFRHENLSVLQNKNMSSVGIIQ